MHEHLSQKYKPVAEQLQEKLSQDMAEEWEKDIELYFQTVQKLNFYENTTVNDWSNDREIITIAEYLEICRQNMNKGFCVEASERLWQIVDDLCKWSKSRLSPVLTEHAHKLDQTKKAIQVRNERLEEEYASARKELEDAQATIEAAEQVRIDNIDLKAALESAIEYMEHLAGGKSLDDLEHEKLHRKIHTIFGGTSVVAAHKISDEQDSAANNLSKTSKFR